MTYAGMKITATQYARALFETTSGKSGPALQEVVMNFAALLKRDRQLKNFPAVVERFGQIWDEQNGVVEAVVTSVRTLENFQIHEIESFIKAKYQAKEVVIKSIVDPKVQGGVIVQVGNEVMDASIQKQLYKLRNALEG